MSNTMSRDERSMKNVIVTGGAGFLGTNLVNYFLNREYKVLVFDNFSRKGSRENLRWLTQHENSHNMEIIEGDIRFPPGRLGRAVESADALFHLAGQVAVTTSVADPWEDFQINAQGTLALLELVRTSRGKRPVFFYSSTNKVYGGMEDVAVIEGEQSYAYRDAPRGIDEGCNLNFHSPYGCSKGCADQYVRDYARIYGMQTIVFRQSCIYGCRQFGIEDQGWVAWFVIAALLDRPITIYGNGKQVRDVLWVDDLNAAIEMGWQEISTTSGKIYNIGGGPDNAISLLQLTRFLKDEANPALSVRHAQARPGDQLVYVSDITNAKRDFGWQPNVNWAIGVRRLVDWVRENRDLCAKMV